MFFTKPAHSAREASSMSTDERREAFLVDNLFQPDTWALTYTFYDRLLVGGILPLSNPMILPNPIEIRSEYFLERRELGVINIGGSGLIWVDGVSYALETLDALYIGKGCRREVKFESADAQNPAKFYLLSAPAHQKYPTTRMTKEEASPLHLGDQTTANRRTIYKYIHLGGIASCQLVMGLTVLDPGNVWNTMPPHTHDRRSEVYLYFQVPEGQAVLHMMGTPQTTQPLWVQNEQVVLSPHWSIHAGAGTTNYAFIWGMAGENLDFTDMDPAPISTLR